jgi:uncharacterized protein (AIM24 family)
MSTLSCQWCQAEFESELTSCPRCGASADVREVVDEGGWIEVPPIKDMAEVQFGKSHAQIEGLMVGVVDVDLAEGNSVYCTHDKLLWHDGKVKLSTKKGGVFKSLKSGTPLTLLGVDGPGRVGFSDNHPGELVAMPLQAGEHLISRQHHMVIATGNVAYDGYYLDRWYETVTEKHTDEGTEYEYETERPFGQFEKFTTGDGEPGLVILHAIGNLYMRILGPGETIDVAPHSILAWKGGNEPGLMVERKGWHGIPSGWNHYISARLQGPMTVWIQSGAMGKTQEHKRIHRYGPQSFDAVL